MGRVLRRHSRGLLDKLFGETDPLPVSRRRTSHSPHICNRNRMQKMCVYRSSKKLHVKNPRRKEKVLVVKGTKMPEPRCQCRSSNNSAQRCNANAKSLFVTIVRPFTSRASRLLKVGRHALGIVVAPHLAGRAVGASFGLAVAAAAAFPDGCYGCGAAACA
jgi:hypothetical protein